MQVNVPQSKRKDPLELIMNGLQIAGGILGIRKDMVQTEALQKQQEYAAQESEQKNTQFESAQEEIARRKEGRLLPTEELDVSRQFSQVPEGTKGAVRVISPTSQAPVFYKPIVEQQGLTPYQQAELGIKAGNRIEAKKSEQFSNENTLRTQYQKESAITQGSYLGFQKVKEAANDRSGPGDLALIFGYMKTIDPTSTVREGEFANAENSGGIPAKLMNIYNKAINGERLSDAQRTDFIKSAANQLNAHLSGQKLIDQKYSKLASQYKLNQHNIIDNNFKEISKEISSYLNPNSKKVKQEDVGATGATTKRKSSDEVMNEFLSQ